MTKCQMGFLVRTPFDLSGYGNFVKFTREEFLLFDKIAWLFPAELIL